ncbi:hypothetical protein J4772_33760 [Cohnella sp. LGH]|uniref:glycerophosphodiester phosphodiesterase family protein n=1 Tax=Cohnella sp. LGH TaxID=1619153 RepID=UPI001ADA1D49|nr:glycerophosphodiester phosphodiesterase family protein [Cohnella sp. LGH]QTH42381.1 hypothetical protein J4772_33760 [Cohnella sp. LGH]
MLPRMAELVSLERESIYIPPSGMPAEKRSGKAGLVYAAYCSSLYRRHGVWIRSFADIVLDRNDRPIYFHASSYIPHLTYQGYGIKVVEGSGLLDYLGGIPEGAYAIVSVKDEGSQQITDEIAERLRLFGMTKLDRRKLRHSYVWIGRKKEGTSYEVLHEECSVEELRWEGMLGETEAVVASGGSLSTNVSSIRLNGIERSPNQRGLNIVTWASGLPVESTCFDTFATLHAQGSLYRADPPGPASGDFRTIGHAGGRLDGVDYTNCLEAFELSYTQRGHRVFEADILLTLDGEPVLRHDWEAYLYRHLHQKRPEGQAEGQPLTLEQFKSLKILNRYTPVTAADLFSFLIRYPDACMVTDTKHSDPRLAERQFSKLVEAAAPFGYDVLLRVIPQLYTEEMYDAVERVFPFPRYVYTLYQTKATDDEVVRFAASKGIRFVAASSDRYSMGLGQRLKDVGASVFLHTINDLDSVRRYVREQVDGFYTDALTAAEVDRAFVAYEVELHTRREMLSEFLVRYFDFPDEKVCQALDWRSLDELAGLSGRLFDCRTGEEVYSLLNPDRRTDL